MFVFFLSFPWGLLTNSWVRLTGEATRECGNSGADSKPQSGLLVGQGRLRPRGSREQPKVTPPKLGLTPVVCLPAQDLSRVLPASQLRAVCPPVFQRARRLTADTCWPNGVLPGLIKPFAQRIMRLRENLRCPRSHSMSPSSLSPGFPWRAPLRPARPFLPPPSHSPAPWPSETGRALCFMTHCT